MNNKYLFLDDVRMPIDAYVYTKFELFKDKEWDVVRNYNAFVYYIEKNGLPKFISFDHDLGDDEKTGFNCADFIVMHCIRTGQELPECYCHSMNPIGKDKIINRLKEFESLRESFQKIENHNEYIDDLMKELDRIQSKGIEPGEWDRLVDFFEEIHPISKDKILNTFENFEQRKNFLGISTDKIIDGFECRFIGNDWIIKYSGSTGRCLKAFYKTTPEYKYKRGMRKSYSKHKNKKY